MDLPSATRVLYSNSKRAAETPISANLLPYIVSSDLATFGGIFGAVAHVLAWTAAFIVDITLLTTISPTRHAASFELQVTSLVTLLVGLSVLGAVVLSHMSMSSIPNGGLHPFVLATLRITVSISFLMTLLQLQGGGGVDIWYANSTVARARAVPLVLDAPVRPHDLDGLAAGVLVERGSVVRRRDHVHDRALDGHDDRLGEPAPHLCARCWGGRALGSGPWRS